MRKILICSLLGLSHFFYCGILFAQTRGDSTGKSGIIDTSGLSDEQLLEMYKASFDDELMGFLSAMGNSRTLKSDTAVADMDRSSHAEAALGFVSHLLVNGRDEGLNGVGFFPSAAYFHKTGIYCGLTMGFLTDSSIAHSASVPITVLTAGYQNTFFRRWTVGLSYSHTFITYGSLASSQLLDNDMAVMTAVDIWKRLIISAMAYTDFSGYKFRSYPGYEKRSLEIELSLRKEFLLYKFIGARIFTITPSINVYFATDNLAFVRTLTATEQERGNLAIFTPAIANFFGFVDVEPALLLDWRLKNLDIFAVPVLAIPFNTFDYNTSQRVHDPDLYRFYVQAGIRYLFRLKKNKGERVKADAF